MHYSLLFPERNRQRVADTLDLLSGHAMGRLLLAGTVAMLGAQTYMYLNFHVQPRFDFVLPVDRTMPFLPWTVVLYASYGALLIAGTLLSPRHEYFKLVGSILYATAFAYLVYLLVPAHVPRPPLGVVQNPLLLQLYHSLYQIDAPGNSLPSLHVAHSVLIGRRLALRSWTWAIWALAICASTLTTHQHVVLDVLGGTLLAWFVHNRVFGPMWHRGTEAIQAIK